MARALRSVPIAILAVALVQTPPALAVPEDPDTTFSGDGARPVDIGGFDDWGTDVFVDAKGRIVVAGYASNGSSSDFEVVRLRPKGGLDTSFSGDGRKRIIFSGHSEAYALARAPGGKILVGGLVIQGDNDFALARLNRNGTMDGSFGTGGKVRKDFGHVIYDVAIQPDGRIVAVGAIGSDMGVARFLPDGRIDRSFSGNGWRVVDVLENDIAYAVAIQGNARIVLAGVADLFGDARFGVVRLRPGGALDTTFGGDGRVTTDLLMGADVAFDVLLQPDGTIVAAGVAGSPQDFGPVRYKPGGARDATFSGDGIQTLDLGVDDLGQGVARQANGRLLVVGARGTGFAVARFRPGGAVDGSFGTGGWATLDPLVGSSTARAAAIAPGPTIVLGGDGGLATPDFFVARFRLT